MPSAHLQVRISALLLCLLATAAPAVLGQAPPVVDGTIDEAVWSSHGFTTDYQASDGSTATLHQIDDASIDPNFVYLAWEITRDFVDNSYGGNRHSTWPAGHDFVDLCESDGQRLQILNVCGEDVVDLFMDYLDGSIAGCGGSTYPSQSGFGVGTDATETVLVQINGGDWTNFTYATSELANLERYCEGQNDCDALGTDLLVSSPPFADEPNYVAAAPYDDWEYTHFYEMRIDRSVFTTSECSQGTPAFIRTDPVELHASPSKTGDTPVTLFRTYSAIGDYVWLDVDRDGIQDAGESGIGNVTVELYWVDPTDPATEVLVGRTVTDPEGFYSFTQLGSGIYRVRVTDEADVLAGLSPTRGTTNPHGDIDLPLQEEYLLADFGYAPADTDFAAVGDFVWIDVDADGVQDLGEPALGGVTVGLFDAATQTQLATATTGPDGLYLFTGVAEGTYFVRVLSGVPSGYTLTTGPQSETNPTAPFNVDPDGITGPEIYLNADFGYTPPAGATGTIGNLVWFDVDEDAVFDAGEPGVGNVTLGLVHDVDGDGSWEIEGADGTGGTADDELFIASTKTANDGSYLFTGVELGESYLVVVTDGLNVLGGFLTSIVLPQPPSGDGVSKHRPVAEGWPATVTVAAPDYVQADFGYFLDNPEALLGDRIWYDADSDGTQDPDEPGIEGVVLLLFEPGPGNQAPQRLASRTTDINGNYFFPRLDFDNNGETYFVFIAAENFRIVSGRVDLDGDGDADAADDGTLNGATIIDGRIDVDGSGTITSADDGLWGGAAVIDGVLDLDGDGIAGETNGDDDADGVLADYLQTGDPDEAGVCSVCDGSTSSVLSTGNQIDLTRDFGYRWDGVGQIGDTVYHDVNANFTQDAGEAGIEGVTVSLFEDLDGDGLVDVDEPLLAVDTTDANGNYLFENLVGRDYIVTVSDQAGILTGYTQTEGDEFELVLATELSTFDVDFGFVRSSTVSDIGDTVWLDADADALLGPTESGISGVTLNLYFDADGDFVPEPGGDDGAPIASLVTDANGNYLFTGLSPGFYFVEVDDSTLPAGLTLTPGMSEPSAVIALGADQTFLDADFGYVPSGDTAVIGDFVWVDADNDGLQDSGEVGIPGVDVRVTGETSGGVPVDLTVTTDAQGRWLVTGLEPGTYSVTYDETDIPTGLDASTPTNMGGDDVYRFTIEAGDILLTLDFGFFGAGPFGTIGDFVWLDVDRDGVQDAGETGIDGVSLDLVRDVDQDGVLDAGDTVLATTSTDADGLYSFTGLSLDDGGGDGDFDYLVVVTDVADELAGLIATSGPDGRTSPYATALSAGTTSDTTADFGYAAARGTIGNQVWLDADGDGVRDPGEDGIQGVTLSLWRDVDGDGVFEPTTDDYRVRTAATDPFGRYLFRGLSLDASYFVDVTDVNGVLTGFSLTSGAAATDDNSQTDPLRVTLVSGATEHVVYADFGYTATVPHDLTGTVFEDQAEDRVFDGGEDTFSGITVVLYRIVDGVRYRIGTTTTGVPDPNNSANDGFYLFPGLPDGDYEIEVVDRGTQLENFQQTTQAATGGVQSATIAGADSNDNDFGFTRGASTTPVTLSWFASEATGGTVTFRWTTSTEVGNVAFHLWQETPDGWRRINPEPIASRVVDSTSPERYRYEAPATGGSVFVLEDVDVNGKSRFHGPFLLGTASGAAPGAPEPIDWGRIRAEQAQRHVAGRARRGGPSARAEAAFLEVHEDGLQRVTYEELAAAGVDLAGTPAPLLRLTLDGEPVALRVLSRGSFGPGDAIEFLGRTEDGLYTRTVPYRLDVAPSAAETLRIRDERTAPRSGAAVETAYVEDTRIEVDRNYSTMAAGDDPWFDRFVVSAGRPGRVSLPLELEGWTGDGPVGVAVELWTATASDRDPDHHVVLEVDGVPVADERFDGRVARTLVGEADAWALAPSGNVLDVVLPGDTGAGLELVMIDAYSLLYPRRLEAREGALRFTARGDAFRVSGFGSGEIEVFRVGEEETVRLAGALVTGTPGAYEVTFPGSGEEAAYQVVEAGAVRAPRVRAEAPPVELAGREAELLVVSHPHFAPGLADLVDRRLAQGWSVEVVDVEAVYDHYGHGRFGPEGILRFLREVAPELGTTHLLLVGGDTFDYFDVRGQGSISFLPSPYRATGDLVRFAPADSAYADLDGDDVPELAVGRFPVRTLADLEALVAKTLRFEERPGAGRALLAADAFDPGAGFSFAASSESLLGLLPPAWTFERVYLDELTRSEARSRLLGEWNAGPSLVSYMGHSGPREWSFRGLFGLADAAGLANTEPSVVTQWGCWTTYYVHPTLNTLGHKLLLTGEQGAAAVLGAATLTEARSERDLARQMFAHLFTPGLTLGEALLESKRALVESGSPATRDVVLGWTLLGDPTLPLVR